MAKQTKAADVVGVNLSLPVDLHALAKSEAAKARKTLAAYITEAIRSQTKHAR